MNYFELYPLLELYPTENFLQYFKRCWHSVFRLQLTPERGLISDPTARYLENAFVGNTFYWSRVVVYHWDFYRRNIQLIRWAHSRDKGNLRFIHPEDVSFSLVSIVKDYWLFDQHDCFLMEFDFRGDFLGALKIPETYVASYVELSATLIQRSCSRDELGESVVDSDDAVMHLPEMGAFVHNLFKIFSPPRINTHKA